MPYLYEYKNNPGYYIRARPPEVGNINYKIEEKGYPLIEDLGLPEEEEISWDTIKVLKALKLIYTDESGTLGPGEGFEPDPEEVEKLSLSTEEAEKLLNTIRDHRRLTPSELKEIQSILRLDTSKERSNLDIDAVKDAISDAISRQIENEEIPIQETLDCTHREVKHSVGVIRTADNAVGGISVSFNPGEEPRLNPALTHHIGLSEEAGIEWWKIGVKADLTWETRAELCRQKGHLLKIVVESLDKEMVDIGSPEEPLEMEFSSPRGIKISSFFDAV